MCETHTSDAPQYSFSYKPSKQDIRSAANALHNRRRWTETGGLVTQVARTFLMIVIIVLIAVSKGQEIWSKGTGAILALLLLIVLETADIFRALYWPECVRVYMRDRADDVDQTKTYTFYEGRVEIEGSSGRLTHAYEAYDRLVLTPDMFFLLIFEYRGEHLPWSVVPAGQREAFRAFLLDRAAAYNVPVEAREKKARRKSK